MYVVSKSATAHALLWFTPIQCIEREENPAGLTPKIGFISTQPIQREIGQISQTQKAASELCSGPIVSHVRVRLSWSKQCINNVSRIRE
jgi:hypothetical protein